MKDYEVSLFLPIYNEEEIFEKHISRILSYMETIKKKFEIIIIDDNSSDDTMLVYKKIYEKNQKIRYIKYNDGPSRRENLAKSFVMAKGDIIAFMDIDLATDLKYGKKLFEEIEKGADISMGSRYIKGSCIKRKFLRGILSYAYNLFMQLYFDSKIKDHQCGFKAFKKDVVLNLIKDMGYNDKRGWFWDAEILLRAQRKSYKIVEFPINWYHGYKSEFNIKRELRMIPYILKLKKRLW